MDNKHSVTTNLGALDLVEFYQAGNRRRCPVCDRFLHTATCPLLAILERARALLKDNAFWPKSECKPIRSHTQEQHKPEGATMGQLVERGIKAAGGYPCAKGWKVIGYSHSVPKTTGSLVTLRKDYRIFANVSRIGAHHMTGRVYSRLIARGNTMDKALAKAIAKVRKMRASRKAAGML